MAVPETTAAWDELFERLPLDAELDRDGYAAVTAGQIKQLTGREPRLMAKFDTREQRPRPLRDRECTVMPVTNQAYWVIRGDGYADLPEPPVTEHHRPAHGRQLVLESLPMTPQSEAEAIEMAAAYGLLERFVGEPRVVPTRRGRRRTRQFGFRFRGERDLQVQVDGVQVEIDGCFEGERVYVVEAKLGIRQNFHTRQLYYPLRMLRSGVSHERVGKPIVPLFLTYSNGLFTLDRYDYADESDYHSLVHVQSARYTFDPDPYPSLEEVLGRTSVAPEPADVPFPQADSVDRLMAVLEALGDGVGDRTELAERLEFDVRHSGYYGDAARYLGLARSHGGGYALTALGERLVGASPTTRFRRVVEQVLTRPVFRAAAEQIVSGRVPPVDAVSEHLARVRPELSDSTRRRRASTVIGWVKWARRTFPPLG